MNIKQIALSAVVSVTVLTTGSFAQGKSENKMLQSAMNAKIINGTQVSDSNLGDNPDGTMWVHRPYENNEDETRELCVAGADSIRVKISGEIEANYDFLDIISSDPSDEGIRVSGALTEDYIVEGYCISVRFSSDGSVTKEGFTITVEDAEPIEPATEWIHRPYENNEDETRELCVAGADSIRVTFAGEIEANYDFLDIISSGPSDERIRVSGALAEGYYVEGDCIFAHFTSDGSVTKEGFTITVEDAGEPIIPVWIHRPYENNEDETKQFCVDGGAYLLRVQITGEIEANYDFLSISDTAGNEVEKLTGLIAREFFVEGNCISAHFTSDSSVTKEGFTILIEGQYM